MSLYKPSSLLEFLSSNSLRTNKKLSQHFLIDGNIIEKILKEAHVGPGDLIIEIGPGPGALTEALLKSDAYVLAIEKDKKYANLLSRLQTPDNRLTIYQNDFLTFSLEDTLRSSLFRSFVDQKRVKVVANLPYQISSLILHRTLPLSSVIQSMTIMVQKEFAQRMVAKKQTPNYSHLSLLTQFYSNVSYAFTVKPGCFLPAPKVDSAVVTLELMLKYPAISPTQFFEVTRRAFQQRRKTLRKSLKQLISPDILQQTIPENLRPEELSIEDWVQLFVRLESSPLSKT